MSMSDLQIFATLAAFVAFIGVAWWAYSPKNKERFEKDAQLALDDDMIQSSAETRNKDKK